VLFEAIMSYDDRAKPKPVSESQIGTLLRVWPKESNVEDILKE
jgi:hypothetical protein